jgi:hypothetical protein
MTGPLIRLKAAEFWKKIPVYKDQTIPSFSDGWLTGFKRRHSITWHTYHGEAASVPESIYHEMEAIQAICDTYKPDDIYDMDETGLYWRRMPNGGLSSEGRSGQERDKTRISLLLLPRMQQVRTNYHSGWKSISPPRAPIQLSRFPHGDNRSGILTVYSNSLYSASRDAYQTIVAAYTATFKSFSPHTLSQIVPASPLETPDPCFSYNVDYPCLSVL